MRPFVRALAVSALSLTLIASSALAHKGDNGGDNDEHESGPPKSAPEIDPGLLGGGIALLSGGLLILRNRRRA